jgi:hypothetical protein
MLQRLGLGGHDRWPARSADPRRAERRAGPAGRHDVLNLVAQLGRRTTVLFSSHILDDIQRVCDTVGVLRQGSLLFQGPMDELLTRASGALLRGDAPPAGGRSRERAVAGAVGDERARRGLRRAPGPGSIHGGGRTPPSRPRWPARTPAWWRSSRPCTTWRARSSTSSPPRKAARFPRPRSRPMTVWRMETLRLTPDRSVDPAVAVFGVVRHPRAR